jgi:hypothetical protein
VDYRRCLDTTKEEGACKLLGSRTLVPHLRARIIYDVSDFGCVRQNFYMPRHRVSNVDLQGVIGNMGYLLQPHGHTSFMEDAWKEASRSLTRCRGLSA